MIYNGLQRVDENPKWNGSDGLIFQCVQISSVVERQYKTAKQVVSCQEMCHICLRHVNEFPVFETSLKDS